MFAKVLKLPYAGGTLQNRIFVYGQRFIGLYWSSSICRAMNAYSLYFKSSDINPQVDYDRSKYYSVRYFKDAK
jgi:hypothetical protein